MVKTYILDDVYFITIQNKNIMSEWFFGTTWPPCIDPIFKRKNEYKDVSQLLVSSVKKIIVCNRTKAA